MKITRREARLIIRLIGIAEGESLIDAEEIKLAQKIALYIPVSKRSLESIRLSLHK